MKTPDRTDRQLAKGGRLTTVQRPPAGASAAPPCLPGCLPNIGSLNPENRPLHLCGTTEILNIGAELCLTTEIPNSGPQLCVAQLKSLISAPTFVWYNSNCY